MTSLDRPLKLVISGKLRYEDEISVAQAAQIVAFLDGAQISRTDGAPVQRTPSSLGLQAPTVSGGPREALDASKAKTNPEKIVALALHVLQDGAKESFSLDDIRPQFRRAREPVPGNMTRDLDAAIRLGWVAASEAKGEFYVTAKAAGVLHTGFDTLRGVRTRATGSSRKSRKPTVVPEVFANFDDIQPTLEGFGDYHKMKTKADKLVWAVNAANAWGVAALSNKELSWLTNKLGDAIGSSDVGAYYRSAQKAGYVNRSTQDSKIRMLPKGIEYLTNKANASAAR